VAVGVGAGILLVGYKGGELDIEGRGMGVSVPSFGTALHAGVVAARVTRLDKAGVALRGQALVYGSAQTMRRIA
jgi:hypothetical protein